MLSGLRLVARASPARVLGRRQAALASTAAPRTESGAGSSSSSGEAPGADGAAGAAAAAAACPVDAESLADTSFEALRMMQHRGGRVGDPAGLGLRRKPGVVGSRDSHARGGAKGVGVAEGSVHRSTIADRQFLSNDGAGGRTLSERARNASISRVARGVTAASDYRYGSFKQAEEQLFGNDASAHDPEKYLEEIDRNVDEQIAIAIANGDLDNLEGKGKPLAKLMASDNPYLDSTDKLGFALLQKHGFAPEWIEQQKRVHQDLARLVFRLAEAWADGDCEPTPMFITRKEEFRRELAALNRRVRDYNLSCPQTAQMVQFSFADEVKKAKREAEAMLAKPKPQPPPISLKLVKPRMTPIREIFRSSASASSTASASAVPQPSVWARVSAAFKFKSLN